MPCSVAQQRLDRISDVRFGERREIADRNGLEVAWPHSSVGEDCKTAFRGELIACAASSAHGSDEQGEAMATAASELALPKLAWQESPNQSTRSQGIVPYLIVAHRPVGSYHGSADWLCNPKAQASAHVLTEGNGTGVDEATQLVAWDKKAWAC